MRIPFLRALCVLCGCVCFSLSFLPAAFAQEKDPNREQLLSLRQRLTAAEAPIPPERRLGPGPVADARLALRKAIVLVAEPPFWSGERAIKDAFAAVERAIVALEHPQPAPAGPRRGFQERAYVSEIDGSPEPYVLYVPTGYDPARPCPLVVFLHGYYPGLNPANWIDLMYSPSLQDVCERNGAILLLPFGRSNTEFMGIGQSDVLRAIDYVCAEYNVDRRRVVLSGSSMGGSGAWSIACHYPDRFAAVATITGRADYYAWMKVQKTSLPLFKQAQIDSDYARELVPNLLHVPAVIFHGELDMTIPIAQSVLMHTLMTEAGNPAVFVPLPGCGHSTSWTPSFEHARFRSLIQDARAPAAPETVRFRTFSLKYPGAYWAAILQLDRWGSPAEIRAQAHRDNRIEVITENVGAFRLGPDLPPFIQAAKVRVTVNGRDVQPERRDGALTIRLSPEPPGDLRKTSALCGPVREAFDGPFTIVFPSRSDGVARLDALNARRLILEWNACAQGWPAVKSDRDITPEDIRDRNLILCGSPETNTLLARIADKLPLKMRDGTYQIGAHRVPMDGNGVRMIYPNPLSPKRYVLIVHGAPWAPDVEPNHKLDLLPDFILYSGETVQDGTLFPTNRFHVAGYFDSEWKVGEVETP